MSLLGPFLGLLKILSTLVLIVAIAVSVRYRSTNTEYLTIRLLHSILSFKHYLILDRARPTLSAEYRAFEDVLRMQPLIGKDLLEDPITVVKKLRSNFDIGTIIPKPSQCQINKEVFEHDRHFVDTYWVDYSSRKLQTKSEKLLFYLHGGGYALGDIDSEFFVIFRENTNRIFNFDRLRWNRMSSISTFQHVHPSRRIPPYS
jgi:hypothetical protein